MATEKLKVLFIDNFDSFTYNLVDEFGKRHCVTKVYRADTSLDELIRAAENFAPDLIVIANGQDANQFDPNGRQCLTMAGFHALGSRVRTLAASLCHGKVVMTQEGGYNPTYAPYCAYAVVAGLLDREMGIDDPIALYPDDEERAERDVSELIARHPLI